MRGKARPTVPVAPRPWHRRMSPSDVAARLSPLSHRRQAAQARAVLLDGQLPGVRKNCMSRPITAQRRTNSSARIWRWPSRMYHSLLRSMEARRASSATLMPRASRASSILTAMSFAWSIPFDRLLALCRLPFSIALIARVRMHVPTLGTSSQTRDT